MDRCNCADGGECWHFAAGYEWCRPCQEHHRPPECAINDRGEALAPCGCTWAETEEPGYYDQPCRHDHVDSARRVVARSRAA